MSVFCTCGHATHTQIDRLLVTHTLRTIGAVGQHVMGAWEANGGLKALLKGTSAYSFSADPGNSPTF